MNILFVATDVDPSGKSGANIATNEVISAILKRQDYQLSIICPYPTDNNYREKIINRVKSHYFLYSKKKSIWWNLKIQYQFIFAFLLVIRKERPQLIITRMGNCLTLPILASLYKIPYYVLIRGLGHREIKKRFKIPNLNFLWKIVAKTNYRAARLVIVAYEEIKQELLYYRRSDQAEPIIFTNAVCPDYFPLINKLNARSEINIPISDEDFVIGFVGSMKERHRIEYLINSVHEVSKEIGNLKVLLVGDGPIFDRMKMLVKDRNMDNSVIFTGFIQHELVCHYMAASDILYGVLDPSEYENPIKCYEYLASARPIITSVKKEFNFVKEYNFGITINSLTVQEISEAIKRLYFLSEDERVSMGLRARNYVLAYHTWDHLIELIQKNMVTACIPSQGWAIQRRR